MVRPQNFQGLLIYLALQHCLQNPNTTFQYWDMSHQMTWYILAHMPYFCRPGRIYTSCVYTSKDGRVPWACINLFRAFWELSFKIGLLQKF